MKFCIIFTLLIIQCTTAGFATEKEANPQKQEITYPIAPPVDPRDIYIPNLNDMYQSFHFYVWNLSESTLSLYQNNSIYTVEKMSNGRVHISLQPILPNPEDPERPWRYNYAEASSKVTSMNLFEIPGIYGDTKFISVRSAGGVGYHVMYEERNATHSFEIRYSQNDKNRSFIGNLQVNIWAQTTPERMFHEMCRYIHPDDWRLEKLGCGNIIRSKRGIIWMPTYQMYIQDTSECSDEFLLQYMNRLGSVIPDDFIFDFDQWIENEIRWKLEYIDKASYDKLFYGKNILGVRHYYIFESSSINDVRYAFNGYLSGFLQMFKNQGNIESSDDIYQVWYKQNYAREWLWANRKNFKLDEFAFRVLKGPDQYDPDNPPVLPDEIKGPPKPTPEYVEELRKEARDFYQGEKDFFQKWSEQEGVIKIMPDALFKVIEEGTGPSPKDNDELIFEYETRISNGYRIGTSVYGGNRQIYMSSVSEISKNLYKRLKSGGKYQLCTQYISFPGSDTKNERSWYPEGCYRVGVHTVKLIEIKKEQGSIESKK